jgi:predicted Zn-dependent protease
MNARYGRMENGFSEGTLKILKVSLAALDSHATPAVRGQLIREQVEHLTPAEISDEDRTRWLAEQQQQHTAPVQRGFTNADVERFNLALKLYRGAMYVEAQQQLDPLVARMPEEGPVRFLGCQIALMSSGPDAQTLKTCEDGASAAVRSARPTLLLAEVRLQAKDPKGAVEAMERGAAMLEKDADDAKDGWLQLAVVARKLSCLTLAEQAAAKSEPGPDVTAIKAWAQSTRRWMGLPTPAASCEREHLERFREAQRLMASNQLGPAGKQISGFASGPARDTLHCEQSMRRGAIKDARSACERAIAAWPESTLGHYLLGVIAEMEHRTADVVVQLTQVVELDPAVDDAYFRLAAALRVLGKTDELARLKTKFQAQFNRPLP